MNYTGKPVRVTTVLSRFKPAEGLIYWAWDLGRRGLDYRQEKAKAGDIGTVAHNIIQAVHKGTPDNEIEDAVKDALHDEAMAARAFVAAENFLRWARSRPAFQILMEEVEVTSAIHHLVGHVDAVARDQQRLVILDWKTSNAVYPEYVLQLGAYAALLKEDKGLDIEGAHLIRFSKDEATFEPYWFTQAQLDDAFAQFVRLREAYEAEKAIKKMIKSQQRSVEEGEKDDA